MPGAPSDRISESGLINCRPMPLCQNHVMFWLSIPEFGTLRSVATTGVAWVRFSTTRIRKRRTHSRRYAGCCAGFTKKKLKCMVARGFRNSGDR